MDRRPAPEARFSPDRRYTAFAGGGAVAALLIAAFGSDKDGRLLAVIAAVVLIVYVATDLAFSPRLIVSRAGIVVRTPFTRARLDWADVADVRADTRLRWGLRSTALEIDAGPVLAVLSKRTLGADPVVVADIVTAFRPG